MGTRDPRIDTYIAKRKDFAKPILTHLRNVVHAACPDVEETLKWNAPFFVYNGGVMCSMAETKAKRVAQAVKWIAEGKARNWKHQDC